MLVLLDFLGTLLFFYNISCDYAPYEACFHTYFGICWGFYSLAANCPTNAYQNSPISWTFSDILLKSPTLCFAICQKRQFRHSVCIIAWTFLRNPTKVQLLPSYASNKKLPAFTLGAACFLTLDGFRRDAFSTIPEILTSDSHSSPGLSFWLLSLRSTVADTAGLSSRSVSENLLCSFSFLCVSDFDNAKRPLLLG